jgi:hypothetical protein
MGSSRLKIAVLDDSQFYNALLSEELSRYADSLGAEYGLATEVQSFLSPEALVQELGENTELAFIDYYLGDGQTAGEVIEAIRRSSPECEIAIMSKSRNLNTIRPLWHGAQHFIYKDGGALIQSCLLLKDLVQRRYSA